MPDPAALSTEKSHWNVTTSVRIGFSASVKEVLIGRAQCHSTHIAREANRVICHVRPGSMNIPETLLNGAAVKHRRAAGRRKQRIYSPHRLFYHQRSLIPVENFIVQRNDATMAHGIHHRIEVRQ